MKATKRILSFILALAMILSVCAIPTFAEEAFALSDIDLNTAVGKAVSRLVSMGIINGYPDGTFGPNKSITRAEFCVVMVKFENMQDYINPDALTGFEDLDTDDNYAWARPYVAMAVQRGIINGFEDGTFRAADPVTYEQAIKMIVCSLGYANEAKMPTITNDWSSGYVAKAMQLRVTSGTSIANKTAPTTRGTVAILTSNALDAERNTDIGGQDIILDKDTLEQLGYEEIKGIVTGTYITELEDASSTVPRDHIMIDDEIYEVGFSTDPNEFLGYAVNAMIKEADDFGDYPVVTKLEPTSKTKVVEIQADCVGAFEDGVLEFSTTRNGKMREAKIEEDVITIFNNKYFEYDLADLEKELVSGNVVLIDNNGNDRYDVVRINSYEVYVVASKSSSTNKITLMYDAECDGENYIILPTEESTSMVFTLKRNGKDIKFSEISSKWDVLNIKRSPAEASGRKYYEVIVTSDTVTGIITERDSDDVSSIVIDDKEYIIADSLLNYAGEDQPEFEVGESAQIYLDHEGKVVAAAKAKNVVSSEKYAYLLSLRQDDDDSDYDLEFWMYTTDGKFMEIGAASKITIDGVKYKALDEDIIDVLEESAQEANSHYPDAKNVEYQQMIIYQTNASGLVSTIHTVNSPDHEGISAKLEKRLIPYEERQYKSSSKSFGDFKLSNSTDIIYIPDDRTDTEEYYTYSSASKAFANLRKYHVEAYGVTDSTTAAVVLIYCEHDAQKYTSSTPFLIVTSTSETKNGTIIEGYYNGTTTEKEIVVSEENGPSIRDIGKGDLIRYLVDIHGELIDYQIWFDASDPTQLNPVRSIDADVFDDGDPDTDGVNRILELHSTNTKPQIPDGDSDDYPTATFRLQFGTVTELILKEEGEETIEDESITVSPTIVEDDMDMMYNGLGVVTRTIGSSVKVFYYDRSGRNSEVIKNADKSEILPYAEFGEDATRVITYSASGSLRMIYIIAG